MNDDSKVLVLDVLTGLRHALAREAIDLLNALDSNTCAESALALGIHASVHRLAGGLGFFGLQELGAAFRDLDQRMSCSGADWTVSEIVELLSTTERSLRP